MSRVIISWDRQKGFMEAFGRAIKCSCWVRNLENGQRRKTEIVYSIPTAKPYSPQVFPTGLWEIGEIEPKTDEYLAPYFINTDAFQMVRVWEVADGRYVKPTDIWVKDKEYGIHFSTSPTTLGCIKIMEEPDLVWLVEKIQESSKNSEKIFIDVTDGGKV